MKCLALVRHAAAAIALAALAPGCISVGLGGKDSDDVPPDRFHVLEDSADARAAAPPVATVGGPVVAVRTFRAPGRFDRHVLRRDGPGRVAALDVDYWSDEPAHAVTDVVREALARSGRFRAAVDSADAHAADLLLEGTVQDFTVDVGEAGAARAQVRLRLTWSEPRTGTVLRSEVREAAEPVPGPGTDGLGPAMARAVTRALLAAVVAGVPQAAR